MILYFSLVAVSIALTADCTALTDICTALIDTCTALIDIYTALIDICIALMAVCTALTEVYRQGDSDKTRIVVSALSTDFTARPDRTVTADISSPLPIGTVGPNIIV